MKRRDFLRVSTLGAAASAMGGISLLTWVPRAHAATINKTYYTILLMDISNNPMELMCIFVDTVVTAPH